MGFTQMFLRPYLTPSNNRLFYDNFFLIKSVYKKHDFFLGLLPARATELLNQGKALIALVYLRPCLLNKKYLFGHQWTQENSPSAGGLVSEGFRGFKIKSIRRKEAKLMEN